MEENHKFNIARKVFSILFCISIAMQPMPSLAAAVQGDMQMAGGAGADMQGNTEMAGGVQADLQQDGQAGVTFSQLNDGAVFLKQSQARVCTLASSAMLLRRAAMLLGDAGWQEITEKSIRKDAWAEGTGLKWNFTVSGISVAHKTLSSKEELISMLEKHPEGIVIYNSRKPHAILVTDYTDGVLYCSDPSKDRPDGRYPIEKASITVESAGRCWYVKNPSNLSVVYDNPNSQAGNGQDGRTDANQTNDVLEESQDNKGQDFKESPGSDDANGTKQDAGSTDIGADAEGVDGSLGDKQPSGGKDSQPIGKRYELGNLAYRILDNQEKTVECIGSLKDSTSVKVPDTVKIGKAEYKVTQVGESAFANSAKLKQATVGENVVSIGDKAFYLCKKLKKITVHAKDLREIGSDAFAKIYKKAQILIIADQMETFASLLTGTSLPRTATVKLDYSYEATGQKGK